MQSTVEQAISNTIKNSNSTGHIIGKLTCPDNIVCIKIGLFLIQA